jgi:S-adenosylmethionine hydrolase
MAIVTLTSDWNKDDFYTAAIKGKIMSRCPGTTVIDITNQVPAFNIAIAAFQLRNSYLHFPAGTIHIVAVNNASKDMRPFVALKTREHYFIGYDNGLFGLLLDENNPDVVTLEGKNAGTFPELYVFAEAACRIIETGSLDMAGTKYDQLYRQVSMLPAIDESVINGSVIYIDSYKNAFTNISRELFDQIGKGRPFELYIQSNHYRIDHININYAQTTSGEILAIFNSLGLLEIAINGGNAAELLNLSLNSSVRIKFRESLQKKQNKVHNR